MKLVLAIALAAIGLTSSFTVKADSLKRYETFKLYKEPHHKVTPDCDLYTQMILDYTTRTIHLENKLEGFCEIPILPNPRSYVGNISQNTVDGFTTYTWSGLRSTARGNDSVQVFDYREARRDRTASPVVVQETLAGQSRTYFGFEK